MTDKEPLFVLPEVRWSPIKCKMLVKELGREKVLNELRKIFTEEYAQNILNIFSA